MKQGKQNKKQQLHHNFKKSATKRKGDLRTMKKELGFWIDFDNEMIFFSNTFMKGARQMGSGEYELYMRVVTDFPDFKRITIK